MKIDSSYQCKISNIDQLSVHPSTNVKWLSVDIDYDMIKEYFSNFNVYKDTDTYFGISLANAIKDYSINEFNKGRLCGYVLDNKILSMAGVKFVSSDIWEICAVSTRPEYRKRGYSKSVCSFVAKYILENYKQAICETNISNYAMQMVTQQIGMKQLKFTTSIRS